MKKLLLTGVAIILVLIKPAFASNALKALDSLAYIFFGLAAFGLLGIVFSIVAFRTNKTVWKVLAVIPTIALLLSGYFVLSFGELPLLGYAIMALAVVNVLLISNARKPKGSKEKIVVP